MKYKYIIVTLLIVVSSYLQAQVKVLDPDNMQTTQASTEHTQTISDILPMGNWLAGKLLDSLKIGDTLILTNDNTIRENDLNFSKDGKVTCYTQHIDNVRDKEGNTSINITNSWDALGDWKVENGEITIRLHNPEKIIFKEISKSYKSIKLLTKFHL